MVRKSAIQCLECGRYTRSESGICPHCEGSGSFRVNIPDKLADRIRMLAKNQRRTPRDEVLYMLEEFFKKVIE